MMAKLHEMLGGEFGAAPIVDHDGINISQTRLTIQVDQYGAGLLEGAEEFQVGSSRAINDAGHFPVEKKLECSFLFRSIFVGIADQDGIAVGSRFVFDRFNDGGAEEVPDIGDNDADGSGLLGTQGTPGPVRRITMAMDGCQNPLAGRRSNIFRPAKSSGDGGDTKIELIGKIVESHGKEEVQPRERNRGLTSDMPEL
jgi:hypothetical protein